MPGSPRRAPVALGVEPGHLACLAGTHHELVADDELAHLQRLVGRQAHPLDGILGPAYLLNEIVDRDLREVLGQVLGEGGPVRMSLTTARKRLRSGRISRIGRGRCRV